MSQAVLSGKDISAREVRVFDDDGGVLLIVPFTEAIRPFE
ncbi:translation initiation factor IF-3 [Rhizobium sp. BK077]|nr:translation initiation factor IF-3 [Rhizobium sp. BK112]MBB3372112.1 translation initiation factor IF-3 [Rhizobium sp. BK077]MBB4183264.1 translation initiation factor IF-3 [Rhizobium sp. BK109]